MQLNEIFGVAKPVIGMLHVPALAGSPQNSRGFDAIMEWVLADARTLVEGGIGGLMLENFGDVPFYPRRTPPHTVAFLTVLAQEVKRAVACPLGINILRNDSEGAMAVAAAVNAEYIRVNVFIGARVTDQGVIEGSAHRVLRYRKSLGAGVKIFADVDVKHSAPVAARDLRQVVEEAVTRGCADAIIVTGSATGKETRIEDLRLARETADGVPVLAGSGVDLKNVSATLRVADGLIVGTSLKRDGIAANPIDIDRVRRLIDAAKL
jgi:membrane complex biogenesis BtpA family protein